MLLAIVEDPRGLLIRLADQLVRLRAASALDTATRRRLGEDTLAVFAPLAGRLGVWQLKWQLEDASLRHVEPAGFDQISKALKRPHPERERYIARIVADLRRELSVAASLPRSPADPNTSTASGARCGTRRSDSIRSTTSWRYAFWSTR